MVAIPQDVMSHKKVNKIELAPGIIVYRPNFSKIDEILTHMKESLSAPSYPKFFHDGWMQWGEHDGFKKTHLDLKSLSENTLDQDEKLYFDLYKTYRDIVDQYLLDVKDLNILRPYINYDTSVREWIIGEGMGQFHKGQTGVPDNVALGFHMDIAENETKAIVKHVLTGNVYLNDDYEGGEVVFLYPSDLSNPRDYENFKMLSYKPKQGDFVFYPADFPISHGVNMAIGKDRYLIVSTSKWIYDGSMGESLREFMFEDYNQGNSISNMVKDENKIYIDGKNI